MEEEDPAVGAVLAPVTVTIAFVAAVVAGVVFAESDAAAAGLVTASAGGAVTAVAEIMAAAEAEVDAGPFAAGVEGWDPEACHSGTWRGQ